MDKLKKYYGAETVQKLEKLADLVGQTRFTAALNTLQMLEMCAFILAAIEDQIALLPLDGTDDIANFAQGLDAAGAAIAQMFHAMFQNPDAVNGLLTYIEMHSHVIEETYFERKAQVAQRGKFSLLARVSARPR